MLIQPRAKTEDWFTAVIVGAIEMGVESVHRLPHDMSLLGSGLQQWITIVCMPGSEIDNLRRA
jgi:hypothetical protein